MTSSMIKKMRTLKRLLYRCTQTTPMSVTHWMIFVPMLLHMHKNLFSGSGDIEKIILNNSLESKLENKPGLLN